MVSILGNQPRSITALYVLLVLGAVAYVGIGSWFIFGRNPDGTNSGFILPAWFVLANGLLCLLMGLVYVWVINLVRNHISSAQIIIQAVSILNITFGLFRLPFGLFAIAVNVAGFIIVSTPSARIWFSTKD